MKEDNVLTELFNFLKKETQGYNGFMVCQTMKEFLIVTRVKTSNDDSFCINSKFWHDYTYRWKHKSPWKIIYKYYGEENNEELSDV
jgi:hypothetical protein